MEDGKISWDEILTEQKERSKQEWNWGKVKSGEAWEEGEGRYRGIGGEYIASTMDLDGRVRGLQIPRRKQNTARQKKTEPCMRGDRGKPHRILTHSQNQPTFSALPLAFQNQQHNPALKSRHTILPLCNPKFIQRHVINVKLGAGTVRRAGGRLFKKCQFASCSKVVNQILQSTFLLLFIPWNYM